MKMGEFFKINFLEIFVVIYGFWIFFKWFRNVVIQCHGRWMDIFGFWGFSFVDLSVFLSLGLVWFVNYWFWHSCWLKEGLSFNRIWVVARNGDALRDMLWNICIVHCWYLMFVFWKSVFEVVDSIKNEGLKVWVLLLDVSQSVV